MGFFVGSFINDLIIRGYVFGLLRGKAHIGWIFAISILIYALDDTWYAGFSLGNVIFSIILGLSLTFAFYKTGSIWADTGIHFGLNLAYGLFFGLIGNSDSAVFIVKETGKETLISSLHLYIFSSLIFIFLILVIRFYSNTSKDIKNVPFSTERVV